MKNKKILYILLFILLIVIIGVVIVLLSISNTKETEKNNIQENINAQNNVAIENTTKSITVNDVIEIKEKMFIQQINDVCINVSQYEEKTIKLQGMMYTYKDDTINETYYYVTRRTPGCCGNDGMAGLEIKWDQEYPEDNEWVEAVGTVKYVMGAYYKKVPIIQLTSLEVLEERGQEFVTQ